MDALRGYVLNPLLGHYCTATYLHFPNQTIKKENACSLVQRLMAGDDPNIVTQEELPKWGLSQGQTSQALVRSGWPRSAYSRRRAVLWFCVLLAE